MCRIVCKMFHLILTKCSQSIVLLLMADNSLQSNIVLEMHIGNIRYHDHLFQGGVVDLPLTHHQVFYKAGIDVSFS